jgi:hypothetical protein
LWVWIPCAKITLTKETSVSEPGHVIVWVKTTLRKKRKRKRRIGEGEVTEKGEKWIRKRNE